MFVCVLQDLRGNLEQELDFINEGKNSECCGRDLSKCTILLPFHFVFSGTEVYFLYVLVFFNHCDFLFYKISDFKIDYIYLSLKLKKFVNLLGF
jgi:hypothetical protein